MLGVFSPADDALWGGARDAFDLAAGLHVGLGVPHVVGEPTLGEQRGVAEPVLDRVDPDDRRVVWIELRPEAWQRLAGVYGPAGRQVSEYSARSATRAGTSR